MVFPNSSSQPASLHHGNTIGGDVNVTDEDGDTPLYTVENVETARYLVEHGATVDRRNNDHISPAEHLADDFPLVATYLQSLGPAIASLPPPPPAQLSEHQQEAASEQLTSALILQVQDIMQRAEAEGRDTEEELRQVVGRTVLEGMLASYGLADQQDDRRSEHEDTGASDSKRRRLDDDGAP
ncbi:hypothetical protein EVG20_g5733 [Dentipellis fragilis]|uniref:Uncharacterized protein n=1 Tax=Dentipellis fragilis TaxID=205917 RepID=A0A4Y9YTM4_9AGAM|nr:hypothetical protein EVG20_g5733 [Dentipellis fragilis]